MYNIYFYWKIKISENDFEEAYFEGGGGEIIVLLCWKHGLYYYSLALELFNLSKGKFAITV